MRSRLPVGYVSLIVCDTRRAVKWRTALAREGISAALVETAADHQQGGWEVGVPAASAPAARGLVTEVMQGRRELGDGAGARRGPLVLAGIVVAIVIAAIVASLR
jgi:hypothetical protein